MAAPEETPPPAPEQVPVDDDGDVSTKMTIVVPRATYLALVNRAADLSKERGRSVTASELAREIIVETIEKLTKTPELEALLAAQRAFLLSRGWTEVEPTGAKTFFSTPKLRSALRWKGPSARPGAKLQTMDTAVTLEMILEREGSSAYREAIDFFLHEIRPPEKRGGKR